MADFFHIALSLSLMVLLPAAAGALAYHLVITRPARTTRHGLAVGQIPLQIRRRGCAVRVGGAA